jgi:hypothetical protein
LTSFSSPRRDTARSHPSLSPLAVAVMGISATLLVAAYTAYASPATVQGGWPPPLDLSQSGDSISRGPDLSLAENGDLHVIWMQPQGATITVYHAGSDDRGSNWSYSVPLAPASTDRLEAAMDVDPYGIAHVVWIEHPGSFQLRYAMLWEGSWEGMAGINETGPVTYMVAPDVVATPDFVHAVWSETAPAGFQTDIFYSRSEGGGSWSPATTTVETPLTSLNSAIAADATGNLHLVWEENSTPREIYYISGTVGTTRTVWSLPITVSAGLTQTATTPDIVVGSDGTVHIVFGVNVYEQQYVQDIYYASFPMSDALGVSATLIPGSRVKVSQLLPTFASPAVALFGDDQLHVAWNGWRAGDYANSDRIYYAVSENGGVSWSEPVPVSPKDSWPDGFPSLAADEKFVHVVWQEKVSNTDQDIYYTKRFPVRAPLPLVLKAF